MQKNIFFFWEGDQLPEVYKQNIKFVKITHPEHKVRVVSGVDVLPILEETHPELAKVYNHIRIPAARSDIARLALLSKFGGWYLDCDVLPRVSLQYYEKMHKELYLFWRKDSNGTRFIIQNSVMGGEKNHEFFRKALSVVSNLLLQEVFKYSVYNTTGPIAIGPVGSEYLNDRYALVVEMDYSMIGVNKDNKSKGSWTYQQYCGLIVDRNHPPKFMIKSKLTPRLVKQVVSERAFYYFRDTFEEFPKTKVGNYRTLAKKLALHYLELPKLREEMRQVVDKYMDKEEDKEFVSTFYETYNNYLSKTK